LDEVRVKEAPLILVVEDAADVRQTVVRTLEISGFRVHAAAKAMDAIALVRKERPDLVLLDVVLPDLDGASLAACLGDEPDFASIPIILMSALPPEELDEKMAETAAVDGIPKPIVPGDLVRRVRHWLAARPEE
jgi:CheY-like chemotaxis protein